MEGDSGYNAQAPAAPQPAAAVADGDIQLTMFDKMRRMVSTDEEWDAILLQKMELKRNRGKLPRPLTVEFPSPSSPGPTARLS